MLVIEDPGPGAPIAVVGHALGQDGHECGLSGIDVAYDAQLDVLGWHFCLFIHADHFNIVRRCN